MKKNKFIMERSKITHATQRLIKIFVNYEVQLYNNVYSDLR